MRGGWWIGAGTLVACGLAACGEPSNYKIETRVVDGGIQRTVVGWRLDGLAAEGARRPLGEGEVDALRQAYGVEPTTRPEDGTRVEARMGRTFLNVPSGAGFVTEQACPMGKTFVYAEHVGGDQDPVGRERRRQEAVRRSLEFLREWLLHECAGHPNVERLRTFMGDPLAGLVERISLETVYGHGDPEACMLRLAIALARTGLTTAEEVLQTMAGERGESDGFSSLMTRMLRRVLGIPAEEPDPACLGFLASPDASKASLEGAKRRLGASVEEAGFGDWAGPAFGQPTEAASEYEVALVLAQEPTDTNGTWDADRGRVTWQRHPYGGAVSTLAYATWAEPAVERQEGLFARVVLAGEQLVEFDRAWRAGDEAERAVFDVFLQELGTGRPHHEIRMAIDGLRRGGGGAAPATPGLERMLAILQSALE